ncbi:MAG: hypothetical protein ACQER7_04940 [Bacteroidota bacterium]
MFHLSHKRIIVTLMLLTGVMTSPMASDTDSLVYEDLQYVKQRINLLLSRLDEMNKSHTPTLDSLLAVSHQSLEGLDSLEKNTRAEHVMTRDSISNKAAQLQKNIKANKEQYRQNSMLHFLFHGLAVGLIIFMIFYLRSLRRKSLQYLMSRAESLEGRQDEILQKASELEEIRQNLEKTQKQQKKLKKKLKKGKK